MEGVPVLGIAAWSGGGKTTLIEKLVRELTGRGLRIAVVKHDAHGFELDREGKDSWRFREAGAISTVLCSPEQTAVQERQAVTLEEALERVSNADLILVEGFKNNGYSQLGLCRKAAGKDFTAPLSRFEALVTDREDTETDRPVFDPDDDKGIADFIMQNMEDFTHFNAEGRAKMVDVGEKPRTVRSATAAARVLVSPETFALIRSGGMKKGDVLTVAQIAGIMGAKRTPDLIPMCHPLVLSGIDLHLSLDEEACAVDICATVSCQGQTGVEMEALTAASVAALTVYDMCKAVQKDMVITNVRLLEKSGGVHGDYHREE